MSTVLITGATGFIGGHLARSLVADGVRVRCLVRKTSHVEPLHQLGVETVTGSLLDPDSLDTATRDVDCVYHLAGMTAALRAGELLRINGEGTLRLAAACARQSTPPVLVYVSSVAAAGTSPLHRLRTERDEPRPVSHYGRSKRAGEVAIERMAAGLPASVVRPGIVFGPEDRGMLKTFRPLARTGLHVCPGLASRPMAYIHVADLVDLMRRVAERGERLPGGSPEAASISQGRYFACAPECPTYAQFGKMAAYAVGRPRGGLVLRIPESLALLVGASQEAILQVRRKPDLFNLDKVREATAGVWAVSGEKAHRQLDFTPARPLRRRIEETADWYRRAGWL